MLSRDIIIRLIDEHQISGEEAYQLINDVLQAEMLELSKNLKEIDKSYQGWTPVWQGTTDVHTISGMQMPISVAHLDNI